MAKTKFPPKKPEPLVPVAEHDPWFYLRPVWADIQALVPMSAWEDSEETEARMKEVWQKVMPALVSRFFLSSPPSTNRIAQALHCEHCVDNGEGTTERVKYTMANVRTYIPARQVTAEFADLLPMVPAGILAFSDANCVQPGELLRPYQHPLHRAITIGPRARVKAQDKGKGKQRASPPHAPSLEEEVPSSTSPSLVSYFDSADFSQVTRTRMASTSQSLSPPRLLPRRSVASSCRRFSLRRPPRLPASLRASPNRRLNRLFRKSAAGLPRKPLAKPLLQPRLHLLPGTPTSMSPLRDPARCSFLKRTLPPSVFLRHHRRALRWNAC